MTGTTISIGTRGSDLALWQANFVKATLEGHFPDFQFDLKVIHTTGDEIADVALSKIGDKGLFTRQIENELLRGTIDLAVHSLKDLQTVQPEGLTIGAVCERETPNDVFISKTGGSIDDLPRGGRVATGSLRRRSQLLHYRPDLEVVEIRGNVPTRLQKFDDSDLDGLILAYAGVHRLGLEARISQIVPVEVILPAVGQGAVAVETRQDDELVRQLIERLDDPVTRACVTAERALLRCLEGGCQVPIAGYATLDAGRLTIEGAVGSIDGKVVFRDRIEGEAQNAETLGTELAGRLIDLGAREVLEAVRLQSARNADQEPM